MSNNYADHSDCLSLISVHNLYIVCESGYIEQDKT